jgi:fucose 4-O-acetylase-like acetyltransferase
MRNLWIDYVKAIGIALVVYGHVARGLFNARIPMDESTHKLIDSIIYSFHMPLFFFLSGLLFRESLLKRGRPGLIANKIDSLVYPYILWSLLQGAIEVLLGRWTNSGARIEDVLSLFWAPRAQFWFLYALFLVVVIGAFVYAKLEKKYLPHIILAGAVIFVFKDAVALVPLGYIFANFVFFAAGIYFNEVSSHVYEQRRRLLIPAMLIFVASQYVVQAGYGMTVPAQSVPAQALALFLALVSIAFIVVLCMCLADKRIAVLSLIGSSSMAIYLAHILVGSGTRIILSRLFHIDNLLLHLAAGCLLGIFVPVIALKYAARFHLGFLFAVPPQLSLERLRNKAIKRAA